MSLNWTCNASQIMTYLRIQAETHVSGLIFQCKICVKKCSGSTKLRYHMRNHHDGAVVRKRNLKSKPVNYPKMKTRGSRSMSLIEKKEDQAEQKEALKALMSRNSDGWKCLSCPKFYTTRAGLSYHAESHVSGLNYPCQYCDSKFAKRYKLTKHLKINHGLKNKKRWGRIP